jgi:hypothetical protein
VGKKELAMGSISLPMLFQYLLELLQSVVDSWPKMQEKKNNLGSHKKRKLFYTY